MSRYRVGFLASLFVCATTEVVAQTRDTACTYRSCALRVEPRGFGASVVRGAEGGSVARVGLWGTRPGLTRLVGRSDSAVAYARQYQRLARPAAAFTLAGPLLLAIPAVKWDLGEAARIGVAVGGTAASLYGSTLVVRAHRALSRSIWWHNEALAR
ncbi:MAG: hypothetical protein KY464_11400 [Gemmatimonadetes bacterium]|nr:hypothetical protein [Gemmatimonadota bacterium]